MADDDIDDIPDTKTMEEAEADLAALRELVNSNPKALLATKWMSAQAEAFQSAVANTDHVTPEAVEHGQAIAFLKMLCSPTLQTTLSTEWMNKTYGKVFYTL